MSQCQCLKSDGQRCTREISTKSGNNNNKFCWQHQKTTELLMKGGGSCLQLYKPGTDLDPITQKIYK